MEIHKQLNHLKMDKFIKIMRIIYAINN